MPSPLGPHYSPWGKILSYHHTSFSQLDLASGKNYEKSTYLYFLTTVALTRHGIPLASMMKIFKVCCASNVMFTGVSTTRGQRKRTKLGSLLIIKWKILRLFPVSFSDLKTYLLSNIWSSMNKKRSNEYDYDCEFMLCKLKIRSSFFPLTGAFGFFYEVP